MPSIPERVARRYASLIVGRLSYGLLILVLMPVALVASVLIFAALGVVVFGLYALLGQPGPPLGSVIGIGWFGGSLLTLFLVLRRGHRRLARLIAIADAPVALIDPYTDQELVTAERAIDSGEAPDPTTFHERLAAADARHAASH